MQDGQDIPAEQAGQWLRENNPKIEISWKEAEEADDDTYRRLLSLLFSPN